MTEFTRIRFVCAIGVCIGAFLWAQSAGAQEFELRAEDLRVVGDARWTGGAWGGYHPIRLTVTNFGPARDLELRFSPHDRGHGVPTVRRRVRVEQNATARLTLSIPLVGGRNSGRFQVLVDGKPVEALRDDLSLMMPGSSALPQPSLLVISPAAVDLQAFEIALLAENEASASTSAGVHFGGRTDVDVRHTVIEPTSLPTKWIDYSAVDLVAIRLDVLSSLRPDERTAILDWVKTGGRLIVDQIGGSATDSEPLNRLLGQTTGDSADDRWQPASVHHREEILAPHSLRETHLGMPVPNEGSPFPGQLLEQMDQFVPGIGEFGLSQMGSLIEPAWSIEERPFFIRPVGFGRVAAISGSLFEANAADWRWLLDELGGPASSWPVRHGIASGQGDLEFINLPIPGVKGVPTAAFLTLITLFTFAIGPVNYFWLWRRKQLSRLVVTVPVIAVATSLVLFSYAAVSHGFSTKGRIRSVTLLDPEANTATSISRIAIFSGLAPSQGPQFLKETAVYPLLPFRETFVDGEVDWTETQSLAAGWLATRTRTQFVTVTHRDERGRLTITPSGRGLTVVNGLAVPLKRLIATDSDGTPYIGRDIPAGGEAVMNPLTDKDWSEIRALVLDIAPEPPEGVEPMDVAASFGGMPWRWYQQSWRPQFQYGLLERHLATLTGQSPTTDLADQIVPGWEAGGANELGNAVAADTIDPLTRPRGFVAIASANPGIDLGGIEVNERDSLHVVMGTW